MPDMQSARLDPRPTLSDHTMTRTRLAAMVAAGLVLWAAPIAAGTFLAVRWAGCR